MAAHRVLAILALVAAAEGAGLTPGSAKPSPTLNAKMDETQPEKQVRSTPAEVSLAVKPDGEVARVQRSEPLPAVEKAVAQNADAKPHIVAAAAPEAKLRSEAPAVENVVARNADTKPHIIAAAAPEDTTSEKSGQQQKQETSEESWKSTFFFVGSIVLMSILAAMIIARMYFGYLGTKTDAPGGAEKVSMKSKEASASAAALQQHLNDSSSTSDSGEKIAMLFDRVRRSLEDLSNEKVENQEADVAGQGQRTAADVAGQTKMTTNTI